MSRHQVIGIDPGLCSTGWALLDIVENQVQIKEVGLIKVNTKIDLIERIQILYTRVKSLIGPLLPTLHSIALEAGYCGICGQSTLKLGMARGAIISGCNSQIYMYSPATIKQIIGGKGNADKKLVYTGLKNYFPNIEENLSNDISDAIAVAMTHIKTMNII